MGDSDREPEAGGDPRLAGNAGSTSWVRRGKEIEADRLSGGESVIINEAVSLALAMYRGTREASWREPGLILRDETTSALGDLAPAYIEMFRNPDQAGRPSGVAASHQQDSLSGPMPACGLAGGRSESHERAKASDEADGGSADDVAGGSAGREFPDASAV